MRQIHSQMDFFDPKNDYKKNRIFFIVDGNAYVYKSYYALQDLKNSKGLNINAIYIFFRTVIKLFNFIVDKEYFAPHLCFAFDVGKENFRTKIYKDYKSNRKKMPPDLFEQFKIIKDILKDFGFLCCEIPGYEGDDVIASLTEKILQIDSESEIFILTYDKDLIQLISSNVKIFQFPDKIIDAQFVKQKYGFSAQKIVDFLALCGDNIDNIKGVSGIGKKIAKDLLDEYSSLDYILENINSINPKYKNKILENLDNLELNLECIKLKKNLHIDIDFKNMQFYNIFQDKIFLKVLKKFQDLEMISIIKSLKNLWEKVEGVFPKSFEESKIEEISTNFINKELETKKNNREKVNLFDCFLSFFHKDSWFVYDYIRLKYFKININLSKSDQEQFLENFQFYFDFTKDIQDRIVLTDNCKNLFNLLHYNNINFNFKDFLFFDITFFRYLLNLKMFDMDEIKDILSNLGKQHFYAQSLEQLKEKNLLRFYDFNIHFASIVSNIEQNFIKIDPVYLISLKDKLLKYIANLVYTIFDIVGFNFDINSDKQIINILKNKFDLDVENIKNLNECNLINIYAECNDILPLYFLEYKNNLKLILKIINPFLSENRYFIKIFFENKNNVLEYQENFDIDFSKLYLKNKNLVKKVFISEKNYSFLVINFKFLESYILNFFVKDEKLKNFLFDNNILLESSLFEGFCIEKEKFINEIFYDNIDELVYDFRMKKDILLKLKDSIFRVFPKVSLFYKNFKLEDFKNKKTMFNNKFIFNKDDISQNSITKFIKFNISDIFKRILFELSKNISIKNFKILYFSENKILTTCLDKDLDIVIQDIENILEKIFAFYIPINFDIEIGKNYGEMKKIDIKKRVFTENLI